MLKKYDICKHFKGKNLLEKNIIGIMEVKLTYTGTSEAFPDVVIYKPLFQNGRSYLKEFLFLSGKISYDKSLDLEGFNHLTCFIREYKELTEELNEEQKKNSNQENRINVLTDEELNFILNQNFIDEKIEYSQKKSR